MVSEKNARRSKQHADDGSELEPEDSAPSGTLGVLTWRAGRVANGAAIWFVLLVSATFIYEVIARRVFGNPTGFANQLAAYSMPFIMFLSAAYTLARNGHVMVDALVRTLDPRARARLEIATDAMSVLLLLAVTVIASAVVVQSWRTGYRTFSTVLTFPEYIPQIVMPLGLALLTLQQIATLVGSIRSRGETKRGSKLTQEI
jgi:TRAP-type C4-dicarboxylate transport system permease small subunit